MLDELAAETRAEGETVLLPGGQAAADVRLVKGRHLRPGAVYAVDDEEGGTVRVTVKEWNRRSGLRVELSVVTPEAVVEWEAGLRSADRPRAAEVSGVVRGDSKWPTLSRMEGRARLRLDDWWTATEGRRVTRAPLRARLRHRLLRAEVLVVPGPRRDDDRWDVRATVSVRGRWLLRPVAAVVLTLAGRRMHRALCRTLDDLAGQWNEAVPGVVAQDPVCLRETILAER